MFASVDFPLGYDTIGGGEMVTWPMMTTKKRLIFRVIFVERNDDIDDFFDA